VRKLLALVFSAALLAISIVALLSSARSITTPANAAPNPIEIISISELSSTSVEILFSSTVPKKSLSYFVINAAANSSIGTPKNIKKTIKIKASGLITTEIKNLNPKTSYKFTVSAKTNKAKLINSAAVEYSSLGILMDALSNLPSDWGNPKPIQLPITAPASAPVAPIVISAPAISGVTAPITGATPVTTTTAGTGYTGTVSWSGSPTTFAPVTTYTATITLTPTSAYTLTGLTANFFTVAGATSNTNPANSGVITAVFPATAAGPPTKIAITRASVGTSPGFAFTTQPQITIQDSIGNTVTSSSDVVTATISTGGTLVGTATATASSGVATFSNLGIRGFSTAYTVTYTASSLTTAAQSITLDALEVGNTGPGGGKIFYVASSTGFNCGPALSEKCYYLEAAPTSGTSAWTDATYAWSGNTNTPIGDTASGTTIGTGYKNTLAIVGQSSTASKAATVARAYAGGSNNDWYLPSKDELNQLYSQRTPVGGFVAGLYWSSSEATSSSSWYQRFNDGVQTVTGKNNSLYVRPVRAF
jgi:hypothetical protein